MPGRMAEPNAERIQTAAAESGGTWARNRS
jgi:hypothetical protein